MAFRRFIYGVIVAWVLSASSAWGAPYGAQWYDVSEYLLGKVYVKVFFLESNERSPNTENWTDAEKDNCREVIEKTLSEIRKRFVSEFELEPGSGRLPPGVNLDFITDYETVEVSVEPIKMNGSGIMFSTGDPHIWVNEVMAAKGFSSKTPPPGNQPLLPYPPYQYNVAEYADSLRNEHGTDWATVIFFVDNSADEDGNFANQRSVGPPMGVGGPGLHFRNNQGRPFRKYRDTQYDHYWAIIHEFLHVWYAVDEGPGNRHFREDSVIGYLAGQNLNFNEAQGIKCMMNGPNWPNLCPSTLKQIGWTDSDGDHIPDILDVSPVLSFVRADEKRPGSYRGTAFSPPLPNRNPYSEGGTIKPPQDLSVVLHLVPVQGRRLGIRSMFKELPAFSPPFPWTRNDITINRISSVEYRLIQGARDVTGWQPAEPVDGAFDQAKEEFEVPLASVPGGEYILELRTVNSVGLESDVVRMGVTL